MNSKKTIKSIIKVSISNLIKLLAGILVGFLLPKVIGVTDYGYYKTFTLYATYVGLFHFGFADGIYLKYGDKDFSELDRSHFRLYTSFLFLLEILVSLFLGIIFLTLLSGELQFIFICLVIFMFAQNITNYYQIISQITNRFNELSLRNIIFSGLTCLSVLLLWIIHKLGGGVVSYRIYTLMYLIINILLCCWYIYTYRDISFGNRESLKKNINFLFSFFVTGFPLLIANLCSSLILVIDRQFVSVLFDIDTYAVYAFAYNMLTLITTALSAVSVVLYPTLKRANKDMLRNKYSKLIGIMLIVVFGCISVYFPLCWFIPWFLPKYIEALEIFRVILPGLALSSAITIVMHNFYKTEDKEIMFFVKSIIALCLSICANAISFVIFKSTISISVASIITMLFWYIIIDIYLIKKYKVKWYKNYFYMFLMMLCFYLISFFSSSLISFLIYMLSFIILTLLFYKKDIYFFLNKFFSR